MTHCLLPLAPWTQSLLVFDHSSAANLYVGVAELRVYCLQLSETESRLESKFQASAIEIWRSFFKTLNFQDGTLPGFHLSWSLTPSLALTPKVYLDLEARKFSELHTSEIQ